MWDGGRDVQAYVYVYTYIAVSVSVVGVACWGLGGIYDWATLPLLMHSIEVMCHAICVLACLTSRLQMKMHVETQLLCANEKDM